VTRTSFACGVAATLVGAACSLVYPRHGVQHHVEAYAGHLAVPCGVYQRGGFGEGRSLSPEEAKAVSQCMTTALRDGKPSYFFVAGSGIDSQLAWGVVSTGGRLARFDYDSAPCGGPGCRERFQTVECRQPTLETIDPNTCAKTPGEQP